MEIDIGWALGCLIRHIGFGLSWEASPFLLAGLWVLLLLTLRNYLTASIEERGIYTRRITCFLLAVMLLCLCVYSFASGYQSHIFADYNGKGF